MCVEFNKKIYNINQESKLEMGHEGPAINIGCDKSLPYLQLIGSLSYIANNSRPDISYAVNYLAQFSHSYQLIHFQAA